MGRGGASSAPAKSSSFIFGPIRRRAFSSRPDPISSLLPEMVQVESSNLHEVGFRPYRNGTDEGDLFIRFRDDALFRWENVETNTYARMMGAQSKGRFFHSEIKGLYPSTKLG